MNHRLTQDRLDSQAQQVYQGASFRLREPVVSETIFALASGAGLSAIAVIRASGPAADEVLAGLCGELPVIRRASLRKLRHPKSGQLLDEALVLRFGAGASFTGEPAFELQVHGGMAVVEGVLGALGANPQCRMAEPGEFARRAFLNGRLDLTSAEGLADLIEARTKAQRDQALALAGGSLKAQAESWRADLLELQAQLEAEIDFSDEGDVPDDVTRGFEAKVAQLRHSMEAALKDGRRGEVLRQGFTVVLAGRPNAGKSSLMNALAKREVAIVSATPGTTRDVIEVTLNLDGVPVVLVDTAGLRDAGDEIEQEGIRRARARAEAADLVLWLVAPGESDPEPRLGDVPLWRIATKADLGGFDSDSKRMISVRTGEGVSDLLSDLASFARSSLRPEEPALISRERHRQALSQAVECLCRIRSELPLEVCAEELRLASRALSSLIGLVGPEDVLGEIFGRFCIGK